jgi:selenocysteine lyase/cysteine desulfurase
MLSAPRALRIAGTATEREFDFGALRAREFARLDARGHAYLDYAATALYGASQLRAHHAVLADGVFGNPHSESVPSRDSAAVIERARHQVLDWLDVDDATHEVCFTANASAAIKLVAESYPFGPRAALVLAADNHNSVNGVREYARRAGAMLRVLPLDAELRLDDPEPRLADQTAHGGGIVALPAQSNFSGVRHPLALVARARALGFDVPRLLQESVLLNAEESEPPASFKVLIADLVSFARLCT